MEYGSFIASESDILLVLKIYIFFWLFNAGAYWLVSGGIYRWWRFARHLSIAKVLRITFWMTFGFGTSRFVFGLTGLACLALGVLTKIEFIFGLGITSLCLNTSFILFEGLFVHHEANLLMKMSREELQVWQEGAAVFDSLRQKLNA